MDRSDVRKYQLAQLRLLEYFDKLCNDLGLDYYLVFGTLLGAVRHQGFIPWDPDIDVAMFREDYERLKEYFIKNDDEYVFYDHYDTEKNHISPHALLRIKGTHVYSKIKSLRNYPPQCDGIYIDIFPIDNVMDDVDTEINQIKKIQAIRRIVSYKLALSYGNDTSYGKTLVKKFISLLLSPVSFRMLFNRVDKIMQKYDTIPSTAKVADLTGVGALTKGTYRREVLGKPKKMAFENKMFSVPQKPDELLSAVYGDFMKLPPENERWNYIDNILDSVDFGKTSFLNDIDKE